MSGNQADFLVIEHFVAPLRDLFGDLEPKQEAAYCRHLRVFSSATLSKAVEHLEANHRYKRFPSVAECLEACRKFPTGSAAPVTNRNSAMPWEEARARAQQLVAEFMQRWCGISAHWQQAQAEGWEWELEKHVRALASVQACMIAGIKNLGWDAYCIFGKIPSDDEVAEFMRLCREQAATGEISVTILPERIEQLRQARRIATTTPEAGHIGRYLEAS